MNPAKSPVSWSLMALLALVLAGPAHARQVKVEIHRHKPANLFPVDQPVRIDLVVSASAAGDAQLEATATDYFGQTAWTERQTVSLAADQKTELPLNLGKLPAGYYELTVTVTDSAAGEGKTLGRQTISFGVARFVDRTAAQARDGDYRFGLKMWYLDRAWWAGNAEWDEREAVRACAMLGLQWTRALLQQESHLATTDLIADFPMNVVLKVERFPRELYDAQRYGPMDQWEAKFGKNQWVLKTLPQKEPYQQWLRQWIRKIPPEQNVFEVWNEAWDKMSPEDFATICNWITQVILDERPNAIIGPNLYGSTSQYEFDARVIKAGGMKGMKMVALHPYGKSEDRAWIRDYQRWLHDQLGYHVDLYVTEYGSHSTPEGPARRSEAEQAQRTVRQSLALYAEGIKALIPHWMGQREHNRTYHEHWFGFFRLNHQPKPVLMAYATCAAMIDGSRYVGDLWYGPGLDAMVFERDGRYTLALVTRGERKQVTIDTGVDQVTVTNMVGASTVRQTDQGKLALEVGPDVIYVSGIGETIAGSASMELNPQRWPEPTEAPRLSRTAGHLKAVPNFDGVLNPDEWAGAAELSMINPKVAGMDASGVGYLAWDEQYLYVGLNMRDNEILNTQPRAKLYREDSIELFVSTEPRSENAGFGPHDHQFFITPTSGEGQPIVGEVVDREAGKVADVEGARFFAGPADQANGWAAEVAIPWSVFKDFKPQAGEKLAVEVRVNDADSTHERFKIDPEDVGVVDVADPTTWAYLILAR